MAVGVRRDGTGIARVRRTPGIAARINAVAPGLQVEEVDVPGPPTSVALRGAGWVEAAVLLAALGGQAAITAPNGARAHASVGPGGRLSGQVACGDPLDDVVLRSYCVGAAHMAFSMVTSERLSVAEDGTVHDLTIRSFGIVRAADMPAVDVHIEPSDAAPINGSDAVFAAVAAAGWMDPGRPPAWPCGAPRPAGGVR
jgi:hypothetical protein